MTDNCSLPTRLAVRSARRVVQVIVPLDKYLSASYPSSGLEPLDGIEKSFLTQFIYQYKVDYKTRLLVLRNL